MSHKRNTRKMTNPYIMEAIIKSIEFHIETAQLPKEFNFNKTEKAEFMKEVYIDSMLDLIDMIKEAPYGAIPVIKDFYPIKKGN